MEIDQLKLLLLVARTGSLSQAAQLHHLTRSAVSKSVTRLENELSLKLLERKPDGVCLTADARAILPQLQEAVLAFEQFTHAAQRQAHSQHELKIGMTFGISNLLYDALAEFGSTHPEWKLDLCECSYEEFPKLLADRRIDLGCSSVIYPELSGFVRRTFLTSEIVWGVPEDGPVARQGILTEEELAKNMRLIAETDADLEHIRNTIFVKNASGALEVDRTPFSYFRHENLLYLLAMARRGKGLIGIAKDAVKDGMPGIAFVPSERKRYWAAHVYLPAGKTTRILECFAGEVLGLAKAPGKRETVCEETEEETD